MTIPAEHDATLIQLYVDNDYPSDRYAGNAAASAALAEAFAEHVDETYSEAAIRRRLLQLRKTGELPKLGRKWKGPNFGGKQ